MFYAFFNTGSGLLMKMSDCLNKMLEESDFYGEKWSACTQDMKLYYAESQENYRHTVKRLSKVFITPLDRESIHQLSVDLHAVARIIYLVPRSMTRDKSDLPDIHIQKLSRCVSSLTAEMAKMVADIGTEKRLFVLQHSRNIYAIKREMDIAYDHALKKLYEDMDNPAQFIRKLEGYNALKEVSVFCRNAAHTAEGIVLTHVG